MAEIAEHGAFDRFILRGPGPFAIAMPTRPLQAASLDHGAALWLGPDEWLILVQQGTGAALADQLAEDQAPISLVDISHRDVALRVTGPDAAMLLNGAIPLDLAPEAFPPGMCARTIFEKAEIVLWRRALEEWHIEIARSFAPYVRELLAVIADANAIALTPASSGR